MAMYGYKGMEQIMDKLDNKIHIETFKYSDIERILDIMDNNLKHIRGLKESLPYNRKSAKLNAYHMKDNPSFIMLVAKIKETIIGFSVSVTAPSFWYPQIMECSELSLNTDTQLPKKVQLEVQLQLLKEIEHIGKTMGIKINRVNALPNYNMGKYFIDMGYTKISSAYTKTLNPILNSCSMWEHG